MKLKCSHADRYKAIKSTPPKCGCVCCQLKWLTEENKRLKARLTAVSYKAEVAYQGDDIL